LFGFDKFKEIVFVIIDEIENETGGILELDEEALLLGEITPLDDISYFD